MNVMANLRKSSGGVVGVVYWKRDLPLMYSVRKGTFCLLPFLVTRHPTKSLAEMGLALSLFSATTSALFSYLEAARIMVLPTP